MRKRLLEIAVITFAGSFIFSGCQSAQVKDTDFDKPLAEFEFQDYIVNGILLPVNFQNEEYRFLLDTGTTNTIFDNSFKEKLGKQFHYSSYARGAYGKMIKCEYISTIHSTPEVYLGNINIVRSGLYVCDLNQFSVRGNRNYEGILGMDFLKEYIVQIDFDNGKVRFFKENKDSNLLFSSKPKENKHPEWGEAIPLKTKLFSNLRYIKGDFSNEIKPAFLVDTGWKFPGVLVWGLFNKINSIHSAAQNASQSAVSVQSEKRGTLLLTNNFSVGSLQYKEMLFQKSNISILGLPFLSRHLVTFDFPNKVMYLKYSNKLDKQPAIYIALGQTGCIINAVNHEVTKVDPNSPSYKNGVREKDILIKINDLDVSSLNVVEFMTLPSKLSAADKKEITFTFKRGEEIIEISFNKNDKSPPGEKRD
jgi:hypothetical protein